MSEGNGHPVMALDQAVRLRLEWIDTHEHMWVFCPACEGTDHEHEIAICVYCGYPPALDGKCWCDLDAEDWEAQA